MTLAKEGLGLLGAFGTDDIAFFNTPNKEFGFKPALVKFANRYSVPLSRAQVLLKNFFIPHRGAGLNEIQFPKVGLNLADASGLELGNNNFIERFEALCEIIKFRLQAKTLVDEGGQGLGYLRSAVGFGFGCHTCHPSRWVYQVQESLNGE